MFGRKLIPLSTLLLLAACGRYDGGSMTAQAPSGLVQQVDLEGNAAKAADVVAREEAERVARAQAEQDRLAEARAARARQAAEKAAAKAAEEAAAAEAAAEAAAQAAGDAAADAGGEDIVDPAVEVVPGADELPGEDVEPAAEVVPSVELPIGEDPEPAGENPEVAAEGNLAALLAEEARLAAPEAPDEPATPAAPEPSTPAPPESSTAAPPSDDAPEPAPEAVAAVSPPTEEPTPAVPPVVEAPESAVAAAEAVPAAEDAATGVLPPTWMPGSVPPCDPNDLAAIPLRELSLKQTFGTGDEARAMLRSTGGDEFVVQKGSVVGPDGARVVRVAPGEVLLAVIQFDMGGQPVLVQQSLRMDPPH